MIKIELDEGVVYDMLSILAIKSARSDKDFDNCINFARQIENSIGKDKHTNIVLSQEYSELKEKNREIFELVDWVKANCSPDDPAYKVDAKNYERWLLKGKLQKKFFDSESGEIKHGYTK